MKQRKAKELLGQLLQNLSQYAQDHFLTEEKLFIKYGYPQKNDHMDEHNQFVQQVVDFKEAFEVGSGILSLEVMNFLTQWLVNHIKVSDKAYAPFLLEKIG